MKYRLLAIDLDGTLLDEHGRVSDANIKALRAAREAGCLIVPCTGRGYVEALSVLETLGFETPGVYNTGGLIVDHPSKQTLAMHPLEPTLVAELVEFLRAQEDAVLVFHDVNQAGHDYLVTGDGEPTKNTLWWFDQVDAKVRAMKRPALADYEHAVRVGLVGPEDRVHRACAEVGEAFAGRVQCHAFTAVKDPADEGNVAILEVFAAGVTKWTGVQGLAAAHGIDAREVFAIGDEINDVAMLRNAGLGVAMGNAQAVAIDAADVQIEVTNNDGGVAYAIEKFVLARG